MSETFLELLTGSTGRAVWGFGAIGIFFLTLFFVQLITFSKFLVKLMTFIFTLLVLGFLSWKIILNFHEAGDYELNNIPSARTNILAINKLRGGTTQTNSEIGLEGWIHCGDYDSYRKRWVYKYVSISGKPIELKGSEASLDFFEVDLFDKLPIFSDFDLKWNFGMPIAKIQPGKKFEILNVESLGKGRVWCKIQEI